MARTKVTAKTNKSPKPHRKASNVKVSQDFKDPDVVMSIINAVMSHSKSMPTIGYAHTGEAVVKSTKSGSKSRAVNVFDKVKQLSESAYIYEENGKTMIKGYKLNNYDGRTHKGAKLETHEFDATNGVISGKYVAPIMVNKNGEVVGLPIFVSLNKSGNKAAETVGEAVKRLVSFLEHYHEKTNVDVDALVTYVKSDDFKKVAATLKTPKTKITTPAS